MSRVSGKVVLVTGGASGLGAADARMLADEGAQVILTDVNAELGQEVASTIPGSRFLQQDVRDELRWQEVMAIIHADYGQLDVLVNNAGVAAFADIEQCTLSQYRFINEVMSEGTFLGCKYALELMKSRGGSIINIASVAAILGIGEIPAYSAAKGAIVSLTRSVAIHCRNKGYGIRCNAILPGAHETPMTAAAQVALADTGTAALDQVRHRGQGMPDDVASLVLFLASDESRYVNGAQLVIDNAESVS